ncbi:MAG: LysM peptidoglycan-binding domain-containing protein [Verrucomicrobiota bacterium]|nr:LysM peptidoglycan-binding domain-containing protein [Verrucomicrobiota bacterium]
MTKMPVAWQLIIMLLLTLMMGCDPLSNSSLDEQKDPNFLDGKERLQALDYQGAAESFEKALQSNPKSAAAHFELGAIYENRIKDFTAAIYHYEKYLALLPNGPMADVVRQRITGCKLEIAKAVGFGVLTMNVQAEIARATNENNQLRQYIEQLKLQLAQQPTVITNYITNFVSPQSSTIEPRVDESARDISARHRTTATDVPPVSSTASRNVTGSRTVVTNQGAQSKTAKSAPSVRTQSSVSSRQAVHVVKSGETVAAIARKYGISQSAILAANPSLNPKRLRVGQSIMIPMAR